ncbi:hypothetical protein [Corynebacterium doosanense]|uniref:Porin n=1 Tax=Corynebacterium doosanense CAU 212 = DSM 45436 TaxID=558173 RepID=A0A097IJP8_9CORY|nr:hypothetical protein [Corynebacterium doosanense]AIT62328.1 hypothetical protein CDOO_11560 [Corynebacterium doosanense CAU 212 = DSM 45436]
MKKTRLIAAAFAAFAAVSLTPATAGAATADSEVSISSEGSSLPSGPYNTRFACEYAHQNDALAAIFPPRYDCINNGPRYYYVPVIGRFIG